MELVEIDRFLEAGSESTQQWYDSSISTERFDTCSKFVESVRSESGISVKGENCGSGRLLEGAMEKRQRLWSWIASLLCQARKGFKSIIRRTQPRAAKPLQESQAPLHGRRRQENLSAALIFLLSCIAGMPVFA
jgi:hypothetical protein